MVGRAIREGWEYDRQEVVEMLMSAMRSFPDMTVDIAKVFVLADAVNAKQDEVQIKREKLELEKRKYDDGLRIKAMELAIAAGVVPPDRAKVIGKDGRDSG